MELPIRGIVAADFEKLFKGKVLSEEEVAEGVIGKSVIDEAHVDLVVGGLILC